ncbi:MAG: TetR/AcrR family transcriptional regulator [Aldersonia sp.]|nr:TetR/AcrR family transcriptional regulator [Aldersonia sp.]
MSRPTLRRTTRDRLLDAAETCMSEKGIRATTVLAVAEEAGVSRAWLYRHFPDKSSLLGAAIVRLDEQFWKESRATLDAIEGFDRRLAAGVRLGRSAYDAPGALLLRLRTTEPEEFAACAGAGVQGLVPSLAAFWRSYVAEAIADGDIHAGHHELTTAEWVARILISIGTVPGDTLDPDDECAVLEYLRRYVMPGLRAAP